MSINRTETDRRRLKNPDYTVPGTERIGYSVTAEREKQRPIVIRSSSASLNFVLFETSSRRTKSAHGEGKKDSWNHTKDWRDENQSTRELLLRIESYLGAAERAVWRDKMEIGLEDRIDEVVTGLLTAMALVED